MAKYQRKPLGFINRAEDTIINKIFKNVKSHFEGSAENTVYTKIDKKNNDYKLFLKSEETEFTSKRDLLQIHFKIDVIESKIILIHNSTEFTFEKEFWSAGIQEQQIIVSWAE